MARGSDTERRLQRIYEAAGWRCIRKPNASMKIKGEWINTSRDFFGRFDLLAISPYGAIPHFVQVTVAQASASRHRKKIKEWAEDRLWGVRMFVMYWRGPGERPHPSTWYVYRLDPAVNEWAGPERSKGKELIESLQGLASPF